MSMADLVGKVCAMELSEDAPRNLHHGGLWQYVAILDVDGQMVKVGREWNPEDWIWLNQSCVVSICPDEHRTAVYVRDALERGGR